MPESPETTDETMRALETVIEVCEHALVDAPPERVPALEATLDRLRKALERLRLPE